MEIRIIRQANVEFVIDVHSGHIVDVRQLGVAPIDYGAAFRYRLIAALGVINRANEAHRNNPAWH